MDEAFKLAIYNSSAFCRFSPLGLGERDAGLLDLLCESSCERLVAGEEPCRRPADDLGGDAEDERGLASFGEELRPLVEGDGVRRLGEGDERRPLGEPGERPLEERRRPGDRRGDERRCGDRFD